MGGRWSGTSASTQTLPSPGPMCLNYDLLSGRPTREYSTNLAVSASLDQDVRHHNFMRWLPRGRGIPRYCHSHQSQERYTLTDEHRARALRRNAREVCAAEGCKFKIDRRGRVRQISGTNVDEVLRAHQDVARHAERRKGGPWLSGSFYLLALTVTATTVMVASRLASPWTVPCVIAGSLLKAVP